MEFENAFSRPGKVMDFRKNGHGHGKVVELIFWSKDFSCPCSLNIQVALMSSTERNTEC